MKFSELKGRAVINLQDASKIGEVEDLIVEVEGHHIVSVKVRTGQFHAARLIPVTDVKNVGADAVTISVGVDPAGMRTDSANPSALGDASQPGTQQQSQPAQVIEITSILGNKVVTDAGTMVGSLRDVMVDWVDLTITGYEVHDGALFAKAQEFGDTPDVHYGGKLITIPAQLLSHPK
jgi:uncharacterized protein YrrD